LRENCEKIEETTGKMIAEVSAPTDILFNNGKNCRGKLSKQDDLVKLETPSPLKKARHDKIKTKSIVVTAKYDDIKIKSNNGKSQHKRVKSNVSFQNIDFKPKLELLSFLECSNCTKLPNRNSINSNVYGCSKGHILCQNCTDIVDKCPVCSGKDFKQRSAFAERLLDKIFPKIINSNGKCMFEPCQAELPKDELKDHETFCIHRQIFCPSKHRGSCHWKGPLSKWIQHVKQNKCIEVVFDDSWHNDNSSLNTSANEVVTTSFKTHVGNFPCKEQSVFDRNKVITHWGPILLLSKKTINIWCHVVIQRNAQGFWTLMVYSMLPKDYANKIKVRITVGNPDSDQRFNFSGKLISCEMSYADALNEGHFLQLHDIQIKPLMPHGEQKIFHYSVDLEAEQKIMSEINYRTQTSSINSAQKITHKNISKIPEIPEFVDKPNSRCTVNFEESEKNDSANRSSKNAITTVLPEIIHID